MVQACCDLQRQPAGPAQARNLMMWQLLTSCRCAASWPAPSLTASSPSHPPAALKSTHQCAPSQVENRNVHLLYSNITAHALTRHHAAGGYTAIAHLQSADEPGSDHPCTACMQLHKVCLQANKLRTLWLYLSEKPNKLCADTQRQDRGLTTPAGTAETFSERTSSMWQGDDM